MFFYAQIGNDDDLVCRFTSTESAMLSKVLFFALIFHVLVVVNSLPSGRKILNKIIQIRDNNLFH